MELFDLCSIPFGDRPSGQVPESRKKNKKRMTDSPPAVAKPSRRPRKHVVEEPHMSAIHDLTYDESHRFPHYSPPEVLPTPRAGYAKMFVARGPAGLDRPRVSWLIFASILAVCLAGMMLPFLLYSFASNRTLAQASVFVPHASSVDVWRTVASVEDWSQWSDVAPSVVVRVPNIKKLKSSKSKSKQVNDKIRVGDIMHLTLSQKFQKRNRRNHDSDVNSERAVVALVDPEKAFCWSVVAKQIISLRFVPSLSPLGFLRTERCIFIKEPGSKENFDSKMNQKGTKVLATVEVKGLFAPFFICWGSLCNALRSVMGAKKRSHLASLGSLENGLLSTNIHLAVFLHDLVRKVGK
mmetsp:Transcript_21061/g.47511  ORF Transcript_21061/g.47511 Transcript_21061/m.47511 type:complete len:352 (-) Transcript_21061:83-1138(-)